MSEFECKKCKGLMYRDKNGRMICSECGNREIGNMDGASANEHKAIDKSNKE